MSRSAGEVGVEARCLELETPEPSLVTLVEALKDPSWKVRRVAAERLLAYEPRGPMVERLVELLGLLDESGARNAAASILSRLGRDAAGPVAALLSHPDADRRRFAAGIVGHLGCPEVVGGLVARLEDPDANVRAAAAEALGQLGGEVACRALSALLGSREPLLRVCALEGLAEQRAPPPLPVLVPLLGDAWTRPSAYRLLGLVEHPTARLLLCRALAAPATRDAALGGLAVRGGALSSDLEREVAEVLRCTTDVVPWLTQVLDAEAPERRVAGLVAARALGEPRLALAVARAVRPGPEAELALDVLVRLGPRAAGLLIAAKGTLAELPASSRRVVEDAVVQLAEPSHVMPLGVLLRSGEPELAALAVRALGRTRSRAAIGQLLPCLDMGELAEAAARSLVGLAASWPHEVRQALAPLVAQGGRTPHLVRAWTEVVKGDAAELLALAVGDSNEATRVAVAEVAPLVGPGALGLLEVALGDAAVAVRCAAVRSLCRVGAEDAGSLLAQALEDADPSVLAAAATGAAERSSEASVARLEALARHVEPEVVRASVAALARLGALSDEVLGALVRTEDEELELLALTVGADRPSVVAHAVERLADARRAVRLAAAGLLAVAAGPAERGALELARARELDPEVRRHLEAALRRSAPKGGLLSELDRGAHGHSGSS